MEQPDAAVLTAIGIGAAFGVLVALSLAALLIRLIAWAVDKYAVRRGAAAAAAVQAASAREDPETLNRARAAAVAVTALIESKPNFGRDSDGADFGGRESDDGR